MVHYWNWNEISLKNLRVKIEIIGPENCFPLYRGLHEVLQKWALLQRDHVKWSCDWSGWIKILNREATRRVKEQKIRTHWINSSTHCTVPNIQQLSPTFHTSYCVNPAKLPKCQKEQGVLCKSYTTHHKWSILQCCRLQYYAGQESSSAAELELSTNQDCPGNECCAVSDVMQVQSHADLIIL